MNQPFISFIVPVYGVEPYLRECIESISCQQGSWELILVDDGSPDGCPQICDEYAAKDERIRVVHQKNGGVSVARNTGLDMAQGEWIWFVDGDDYIEKDALQQLIPKVTNQPYDIVRFTMKDLVNGKLEEKRHIPDSHEMSTEELLLKYPCYYNVAMLFSRKMIEQYGIRFSKGLRLGEDMEFQLKYQLFCKQATQFSLSPYIYRIRSGSATKSAQSRAYLVKDTSQVMRNLLEFVQAHRPECKPWFRMRIQSMMSNLLYSASLIPNIDRKELQKTVCSIMDAYNEANIYCFNAAKMRLAYCNVNLYFILNRIYLKLRGLE